MLLSAGDRLGPYEVLALLGSGGMGEVYKARDSRLGREVAIKLLRDGALAGSDRAARFMQEARAASALNHPNIITIHDVGIEAGSDYLVMEYVKGRSLDQMIPRHGLAVPEALRISVQIADALSRAHAAGIIHRDLKPANIMVNAEGQVKVLDFGLAKLTGPVEPGELDPTLTERPHTEDGTILGTLSYMSPEQTEGKKLDPRSDIFSFGAVLYEMLTGRRAFEGGSKASTMAAILREDPKPAREIAAAVPVELERIVSRALRKDPSRRFQHMDDVKVELEELKEESDSGKLSSAATTEAPAKANRRMLAIGAVAVLAIAAAVVLFLRGRTAPEPRTGAFAPVRLTSDAGLTRQPAIWGSGNLIAYASDRAGNNLDIWVQQLQSGETRRPTTHTADDHEPDFSPDGSRIVFRSERDGGGLYQISTLGGAEKRIADGGHNPKFSPDGAWIAYWIGYPTFRRSAFGRIMVLPASGGEPRELTATQRGIEPVWAPDSKHLLFLGGARGVMDAFVVPAQGGGPIATGMIKILEDHKLSMPEIGAWSGDRVIISAQSGDSRNLWRLALDPRTFRVTGSPERLTSGAASESSPALSGTRLIFSSLQENSDIWYLPLNADEAKVTGQPQRLTTALTQEMNCAVTGDGSRVVYGSRRADGADFVLQDVATGHTSIVASGSVPRPAPRISPDGSTVSYYFTGEGDKFRTFVTPAAGGVPQNVCDDCQARAWAWDGRRLVTTKFPNGGTGLLYIATRQFSPLVPGNPNAPRTSWDDRWLTFYIAPEPGRTKIIIVPVHEGAETPRTEWIEATDGSAFDVVPEFSPNGKLIYFQSQRDGSRCLWALRLDPATKRPAGAPFPVHHFHSSRQSPMNVLSGTAGNAVARDKVVYTSVERTGNIWMLKLE